MNLNNFNSAIGSINGGGPAGKYLLGTAILSFGNDGTAASYAGTISGAGGLNKVSNGIQYLSGTNSYSGGTTFSGGTLNINADAALGATSGSLSFSGNSTLQAGAGSVAINAARGISIANGVTATLDSNGNAMSIAGAISGGGGLAKVGAGMLTLSGSNSFSGATAINQGVLQLGNSNAAINSTVNLNVNGGLAFAAGLGSAQLGGLAGSGNLALQDMAASPAAVNLNVGSNNASTVYSGNLSGAGGLNKYGMGTLTMSGSNSIGSDVVVDGGTLQVPSGSLLTAGNLTVGNTAVGTLVQTGGTVGFSTVGTWGDNANFSTGGPAGSRGTYNLSGTGLIARRPTTVIRTSPLAAAESVPFSSREEL